MYAINRVGTPIEESFFYSGSLAEALTVYARFFHPERGALLVLRSDRSVFRYQDLQFEALLSPSQYNKIIQTFNNQLLT